MNDENHYSFPKNKIIMIMAGLMVGLLVAAFDYSIMATAMPKVINSLQEWNIMYGPLLFTC